MGVEYRHYLIPEDTNRDFSPRELEALADTLSGYGLWKSNAYKNYITEDGEYSENNTNDGWFVSGKIEGSVIKDIFGESQYEEVQPDQRYIEQVTIVFGKAKKIFQGGEEFYVSSTNIDTISVDLSCYQPFDEMTYEEISEDDLTVFINIERMENYDWFKGWWKAGIIIDFGKDVPIWSDGAKMPDGCLLESLEGVIDMKFREVGHYY